MTERDPAFVDLFDHEYERCVRVARRILGDGDVAREIAAEAFARAWSRWPQLRQREAGGWVVKVTVNLAIDATRRRRLPLPHAAPVAATDDTVATRLALAAALRKLPERQRHAVALRYLADLPEPEVARALGVSAGTVKTHLHRGLARLRTSLGDATFPEESPLADT